MLRVFEVEVGLEVAVGVGVEVVLGSRSRSSA
jgi:hypothetical protein